MQKKLVAIFKDKQNLFSKITAKSKKVLQSGH